MEPEPMEERLMKEWGLKTAIDIKKRIFDGYIAGDKLSHILDGEKLVVCSYALGKVLSDHHKVGLKMSKLRKFYESLLNIKTIVSSVKTKQDMEAAFKTQVIPQILMLKPQLANAKARQRREVTPFFDVINPLLDIVKDEVDYKRLCDFVQAIVAYHKYCGGKD